MVAVPKLTVDPVFAARANRAMLTLAPVMLTAVPLTAAI